MSKITKEWCIEQDKLDPLASFKDRFDIPDGIIYMDGNSLGVLPKGVKERIADVVSKEWGQDLIKSWNTADWINLPSRVGAKIAPLIGAKPHEVIMADSTSVNLFKVCAAACKLNPNRRQILSEPGNFPTDLYMMQGLTNFLGDGYKLDTVDRAHIIDAITEETAVVLLTQVHYVTGHMLDMKAITEKARSVGALIVWDLSHSTGAVPVGLNAAGADFAVGCGYKYLNGGPGAPAFLYVAEKHLPNVEQPLSGWFGHKEPFEFVDTFEPAEDIKRMLVGTTGVLAASALDSALNAFEGADMNAVRAKSVALTDLFIKLVQEQLSDYGLSIASPENSSERGSHVSLISENGYAIMQALIEHGVIGDFRAPNFMRFGFTPLYLGYEDIFNAVSILKDILDKDIWKEPRFSAKGAVT